MYISDKAPLKGQIFNIYYNFRLKIKSIDKVIMIYVSVNGIKVLKLFSEKNINY